MHEPLADGGVIRKLWIGEADAYRDHLLRLDPDSRHSRFGGGVSDEFIRDYVGTTFGLGAVVHGFFVDGMLRGAAELRPLGPAFAREAEAALLHREPTGRATASARRCSTARCSPRATAASSTCTWPASPTTAACRSWRANSPPNSASISAAWSARWRAARPTPLSVMRELVADSHGFATAVLDVQSRMLKPV